MDEKNYTIWKLRFDIDKFYLSNQLKKDFEEITYISKEKQYLEFEIRYP